MLAPCFWLRSPNGLIAVLVMLVVLPGLVPSVTAQAPTPVLQYGFGANDNLEGGGIHDLSGNGHHGTVLLSMDTMMGVTDHKGGTNAIHFEHIGATPTTARFYLFGGIFTNTTTSQVGIAGGPFTVMSWVNRDPFSTTAGTFDRDHMVFGTTDVPTLHLGFREGNVQYGFWANDSTAPSGFPANEWHHVAWRYDDTTGNQDILVDGVLINSSPGHTAYIQDQILMVGSALQYDGNGMTGKFGGALDGPQVFNVALRDDQVLAIAKDMPIPP